MERNILLLSGNAHPELSDAISTELGIPLVNALVGHFPDTDTKVKVYDDIREADVFVLQPTGPPVNQNIMESLVVIDTLRRASAGRVTSVMPYFGYGRQDRKEASRVPITARLIMDLYLAAGVDRFITVDLHSDQIQGFTNLPVDNLWAEKTISGYMKDEIEDPIVVAPDIGFGKKAERYSNRMNAPLAIIYKKRLDDSDVEVTGIMGQSPANRNALLVDDIVSTATSLEKAAETLKNEGALKVYAAVTHGVLCGGAIDLIEASTNLDRVYVTDSLPVGRQSDKIRRLSIVPLLARAIQHVHSGQSVTELF